MTRINILLTIVVLRVIAAAPLPESHDSVLERREDDPLVGCCGIGNSFHPPACVDCHIPGVVSLQ